MWKKNPAIKKKKKCPRFARAALDGKGSPPSLAYCSRHPLYVQLSCSVEYQTFDGRRSAPKSPITLLETVNFQGYMYVRVCMRQDASTHSTAQNTAHGSGFRLPNQRHWRLRDELMRYIRLYVVQRVGTSDISGHHLPVWRSHCNHEFSLVASY